MFGLLKALEQYTKVLDEDFEQEINEAMDIINKKPTEYQKWQDEAGKIRKVTK